MSTELQCLEDGDPHFQIPGELTNLQVMHVGGWVGRCQLNCNAWMMEIHTSKSQGSYIIVLEIHVRGSGAQG